MFVVISCIRSYRAYAHVPISTLPLQIIADDREAPEAYNRVKGGSRNDSLIL